MPPANPDTPALPLHDIPIPIAIEILTRLFALEARLPEAIELTRLYATLDAQARAITALTTEVAKLRLAMESQQRTLHAAVALQLSDPAAPLHIREVGAPRA